MTDNPWVCTPSLSWLYPWSQVVSTTLHTQLSQVKCRIEDSSQMPPILEVMEYYTKKVNPLCPHLCACFFHHFASTTVTSVKEEKDVITIEKTDFDCRNLHKYCSSLDSLRQEQVHFSASSPGNEPSFTVLVNCSSQGLTTFPTLPPRTTVLDLSHNLITSFYSLNPIMQNYQHISSLILSHNRLTSLDTKLLKF